MNKKYEVIWASIAENDLARIIEYIANDSPSNALKVLNKLKKKALSLHRTPKHRTSRIITSRGIFQIDIDWPKKEPKKFSLRLSTS